MERISRNKPSQAKINFLYNLRYELCKFCDTIDHLGFYYNKTFQWMPEVKSYYDTKRSELGRTPKTEWERVSNIQN